MKSKEYKQIEALINYLKLCNRITPDVIDHIVENNWCKITFNDDYKHVEMESHYDEFDMKFNFHLYIDTLFPDIKTYELRYFNICGQSDTYYSTITGAGIANTILDVFVHVFEEKDLNNTDMDINNLPKKSDFAYSDEIMLNKVKESYLQEYDRWMKDEIKESMISVGTKIPFMQISSKQREMVVNMFKQLGFKDDEIQILQYSDTKNMFIKLKIF